MDLPFSIVFYRWMLGQENSLSVCDLADVVPDVYKTIVRLRSLCMEKKATESDTSLTKEEQDEKVCCIFNINCIMKIINFLNLY